VSSYKIPEKKISVIPHGISNRFHCRAPLSKKRNYIFYAGRSSPIKNIEGLIGAFEMLLNEYSIDIKLKLTGDERKLNFSIEERLRDKVEFVGYPSDDQLVELYRNALLLVFPSFYEGFGFPPLEAMACGCPVVVSNVASLPEICGDAAYYVDPHDVESIAGGIHRVLTDEALRQGLIEKGLERSRLFSWEKSAREHIEVFEEVLSS
jgi:glycosyltransferase involved in cell wall biosynthesis